MSAAAATKAPEYFTIDIHTAAKDNDMAAALKFFEEGGDPNVRCRMKTIALHRAAFYGHLEMAEFLINKGAEIEACDPNNQTPLFWAAKAGHKEVVKLLLDKGAYINAKDKKDRTPLFEAAWNGHAHVVEQLLRRGAKTDVMDSEANEPGEEYSADVPSAVQIQITNMIRRYPR